MALPQMSLVLFVEALHLVSFVNINRVDETADLSKFIAGL